MANTRANSFLSTAVDAADNTSHEQDDPFWHHEKIDATRWNAVFPYQLLLVKKTDNGYNEPLGNDAEANKWIFTLPFPPEALSIQTPFAINGQVTQGGFIEEHNGAPIKMISLSGTTGVLPLRPAATTRKTGNLAEAIFGGTITQVDRVATSANNLVSDVTGNNPNFAPNLIDSSVFDNPDSDDTGMAKTSGYYQMRLLQEFFENYVAFKKTSAGRNYRLAFAMWKDQSVYLVTPQAFVVQRSASSPFEYTYSLNLKAWRRILLDTFDNTPAPAWEPAVRQPNLLARSLQTILDARDVLENFRDVLSAVAGDLDHALFEPLRETSMFLKDAVSVPLAFADLPVAVLRNCQDAVVQYVSVKQAFTGFTDSDATQTRRVSDAYRALADLGASTSKVVTAAGQLTNVDTNGRTNPHPAFDVFRHPEENYDLFKKLQPGQMRLPPLVQRQILVERERVRRLKRLDFEAMRDRAVQLMADFSDAVGAGHPTYTATYHRTTRSTTKTPTPSDFRAIYALNRFVMELNRLAASGVIDQRLHSVDFVAGLAHRSGIAFNSPRSKFAVPFPYGVTLEQLATRYLGSPDRWLEIAALNGLRAPYVDEEGFDLPLLVNGRGNEVSVSNASQLYVGQQVWLSGALTARTRRHITSIDALSSTDFVITVDGDSDLERFTVAGAATLHAFLPDTVNSQMMLYIPSSQDPAVEDFQTKAVPGLDVFDQLLNAAGFDLLLTSTNDLAVTPDGDCRLAVGLTNAIQTIRLRLSVRQGTLNRHPEYGLPVKVGQSIADLNSKELLRAARNLFKDDPSFTGVTAASVRANGPVASIGISVGLRGQSTSIPVVLNLNL